MCRRYIHPHRCIRYIHTLRYLIHATQQYLLMNKVTLHHHHMIRHKHQQVWHLKLILLHTTTHPIRYQMYQISSIQIQVHHILLHWTHVTHHTPVVLNKNNVQKDINNWSNITAHLLKAAYNSKVTKFKLDKDPPQLRVNSYHPWTPFL